MTSPRIAVIVTCFNLGKYLSETLASLRAQTCQDFELLVIDDGSTDPETLEVLAGLPADVRVIRTENRGLSAARNAGVANSLAPYICAVDADDILLPQLLEKSVARLEADPSVAFVSHWLEAFGDESWQWTPTDCGLPALLAANTVNGAALVRRTAVAAVGGWDETMRSGLEDWDLWITLVERGYRGAIIPEILFRYRRRADSMSRVHFAGDRHSALYRRLADKHAETFRAHIVDLVTWKEADLASVGARADDLDWRLEHELLPAEARAREDAADATRRLEKWNAQVELERLSAHAQTQSERASKAETELTAHVAELQRTRVHAAALDTERQNVAREAAALRGSISWRLTRPLRAIGSLFLRNRAS